MNGFTNINIRNISPDSMNRNKSTDTREWSRKLSDLISKTELFLKTAPEGSVWSSKRNNGTFQYYYVQPGTRTRVFIRQNDMAIARELAQKKYVFLETWASQTYEPLEHMGIVDNEHYASNAMKKLMIYEQNDIFINDRLILTYETANDPLNLRTINEIIDQIEYMLK